MEQVQSITICGGRDKNGQPEDCRLHLVPGDIAAVVGPTGSGKSRLLADIEYLAQRDTPSGRQILLNGQPPDPAERFGIGTKLIAQLSQNMNFVLDATVGEFIAMHAACLELEEPGGSLSTETGVEQAGIGSRTGFSAGGHGAGRAEALEGKGSYGAGQTEAGEGKGSCGAGQTEAGVGKESCSKAYVEASEVGFVSQSGGRSLAEQVLEQANRLAGEAFTLDTPLTALSGGQSRALMIADTAILSDSPIVLIDEIENAGIDKRLALEILVDRQKIVIMATHDPILALSGHYRLVLGNGALKGVLKTEAGELELLEELRAADLRLAAIRRALRAGERLHPGV
ncbi:ATP-binding cassette domain-containing protein [Paenibacillus mesotrionivorans]|uniref:ATP-binding cassette domain-containing protein n=1 Tax=Paenibacillus mesotrionivorans TaxID=3160968 RepID=A0ACC7NU36_9BACL